MKLEGIGDQEAQVRRYLTGLSVAIISEANIESFPGIVAFTRKEFPDCKLGIEVSSWGGLITPSQYWPLRSAFGQDAERNGWWLRRIDGSFVETHPNFRLVDMTIPEALIQYIGRLRSFREWFGPDFLFYDECHRTLGFLSDAGNIRISSRTVTDVERDGAWNGAMARLLRNTGGGMVNGTIRTATAPVMITGRYIQNALALPGAMAAAREHLKYHGPDLLVFENPSATFNESTQVILNGLVATFGGCCQQNIGGAFREPIPGTRLIPEDAST